MKLDWLKFPPPLMMRYFGAFRLFLSTIFALALRTLGRCLVLSAPACPLRCCLALRLAFPEASVTLFDIERTSSLTYSCLIVSGENYVMS